MFLEPQRSAGPIKCDGIPLRKERERGLGWPLMGDKLEMIQDQHPLTDNVNILWRCFLSFSYKMSDFASRQDKEDGINGHTSSVQT